MSEKKKKGLLFKVIIAIIAIGVIGAIYNNSNSSSTSTTSNNNSTNLIGLNEVLKTNNFEITVTDIDQSDVVNTGNQFADLDKEEGNKYLIITVDFKNIADEPKYIFDGTIYIDYNGKEYKFDSSETILLDGWGLLLEEVNPLSTHKTNLVYKIASELNGNVYYEPDNSKNRIDLGIIE